LTPTRVAGRGVAIEHGEDDLEGLAGDSVQIAIEVDHGAPRDIFSGGTADGGAVVEHDAGRDFHFDADGLASLLAFPGDGDGGADDDHVEESPEEIHGDGAEVVAIVETAEERERDVEGARDRQEETADVETQHEQKGLGDAGVEEGLVDDASLGGDVEAAANLGLMRASMVGRTI
jgi:hypothetical protein